MAQTIETGPVQVQRYAQELSDDARKGEVRGVLCFEDRGDSVGVAEVGACNPLSSRMLLGLARFVLREIIGHR